jgi:hypothetical protein
MRGDAGLAEGRERAVEAPAGRGAPRVAVDDVALPRLGHRSDDENTDLPLLRTAPYRGHELAARERLVRDDEDGGDATRAHA